MNKLPLHLQTQFFKVYNEEISVADFEQWLYRQKELEDLLGNANYIDLISLNFKDNYIKHEMGKIINPFLDFGKLEEWKLRRILRDLIDNTQDFAKSLIATYDLYCSGYNFFSNLGLGYGLTFVHAFSVYGDWEKLSDQEKNERINTIHSEVQKEAELVLDRLNNGEFTLTGEKDELGHYHYLDHRTENEKKLGLIETIEIKEATTQQRISPLGDLLTN